MHIITQLVLNSFLYCSHQDTLEKQNLLSVRTTPHKNVFVGKQNTILLFLLLRDEVNRAYAVCAAWMLLSVLLLLLVVVLPRFNDKVILSREDPQSCYGKEWSEAWTHYIGNIYCPFSVVPENGTQLASFILKSVACLLCIALHFDFHSSALSHTFGSSRPKLSFLQVLNWTSFYWQRCLAEIMSCPLSLVLHIYPNSRPHIMHMQALHSRLSDRYSVQ